MSLVNNYICVQLFWNCQTIIFAVSKTQIKELIRWKHKQGGTQVHKDVTTQARQAHDLAGPFP